MVYEVRLPAGVMLDLDAELFHDNPASARRLAEQLRATYRIDAAVYRDGTPLNEAELAADEESAEIQSVVKEESRLRQHFRAGRGSWADIALDDMGQPRKVWKPTNPEEQLE